MPQEASRKVFRVQELAIRNHFFDCRSRALFVSSCCQLSDTPGGRHPTFVIDLTLPGAHGFRVE